MRANELAIAACGVTVHRDEACLSHKVRRCEK